MMIVWPGDRRSSAAFSGCLLLARRTSRATKSIVLLVVGLLRLLQDVGEDTFDGFWSIGPYLIALVVCILVVALALSRVKATDLHREGRQQ